MKYLEELITRLKLKHGKKSHAMIDQNAERYRTGLMDGGPFDQIEAVTELSRGLTNPVVSKVTRKPSGPRPTARRSRRR